MNIRPKTVRRLSIVLAACGLLATAGAVIVHFSNNARNRQLEADHTEGLEAFHKGDFSVAIEKLRSYVDKNNHDYDAMYALAVADTRVEGGKHLVDAKVLFDQLHNERPDDVQVSHSLLNLYDEFGYMPEAMRLADELLKHDPADIAALRAKANAAVRGAKLEEALAISQKLNEASPLDLDGQIQTYNLLCQLKRPAADIVARYQAMQEAHPDDPRFELLLGLACLNAKDEPNTLKWFRAAAHLPPPDAAFVRLLSRYFDQLRLFGESRDLLERAAADGKHPEIVKILIERLWQNGRFQAVVEKLNNLDPASESSDADLLAFKAISLDELGKVSETDSLIDAMKKRPADNKAAAWAIALETRRDSSVSARDAITRYQDALSRDRDNAIILCWAGEAYYRLGESGMAVQEWMRVADLMPSWGHPWVLVARSELIGGQTENSLKHALEALRRAPGLVESRVIVARAWYQRLLEQPSADDRDKLVAFIQEIQKGIPREQETLPLLADLQAGAGQRDEAIQTVRQGLENNSGRQTELLLHLLEISRQRGLGLEDEITAKLPRDASASPQLALSRAMDLARDGKRDEGLSLLTQAAKAATTEPVRWQTAMAEYREAAHDPDAKAAWIALGDEHPDDVAVQVLLLKAARSAATDREFFARTIERIHKLTGDDAIGWKVAQAHYLLTSDDKQHASAQAVDILRTVVAEFPDTAEYRVLLAKGLLNLGNISGALDHFKFAVERNPADIPVMLDLVRLLRSQNRLDEAHRYLDRAAATPTLAPEQRAAVALVLTEQGEMPRAVALLRAGKQSLEPAGQLLFAELLRNRNETAEADEMYQRLLGNPLVDRDAIASAADFYASTNQLDKATQVLKILDESRFSKTDRALIRGHFDELYTGVDKLRQDFSAAATDSPGDSRAWQALIQYYIRQNDFDQAVAAADAATGKLGKVSGISTLKAKAIALKATRADSTDLQPLIDALSKDPADAPAMEMLKTLQEAKQQKPSWTDLIAKLKPLSEKYPNYYPLQSRLLQAYVSAGLMNNAAALAEHLMDVLPNDPEPARQAAGLYRMARRWRDMKRSAERWRQRTLSHPMEADIAIADAMLQSGDTKSAANQLSPYSHLLASESQQNPALVSVVAEQMVMSNRTADAQALLQPLLKENAGWRGIWLRLAAEQISPAAAAAEWIRTAGAMIDDKSPEQFAVAKAWQRMGARLSDPAAIASAKTLLEQLAAKPDASTESLMLLASLDAEAGDSSAAQALYRKALSRQSDLPEAMNNLSFMILEQNGDLAEAKQLVEKAISLSPNVAAFHDTSARVDEKLHQPAAALSQFQEAVRLDPENVEARIGLARLLLVTGKREQAVKELQRIDSQSRLPTSLPAASEQDLQALRDSLKKEPASR